MVYTYYDMKIRRGNQSKYGNIRTIVDGHSFASKAEARHYGTLKLLEKQGKISDLVLQPRFPLVVNGEKICVYVADFQYFDIEKNKTIVSDSKGYMTAQFKLKAKLFKALYGFEIQLEK